MSLEFVDILKTDKNVQENVRQWRNKDDIRKWMINQHIISAAEHQGWLDNLAKRSDSKFWVVYFKDVPVGAVYLQHIDFQKKSTEWGFYIGEDEYRSKGLSPLMLAELQKEVFEKMSFETLSTTVLSDNTRAIELYKLSHFIEKERYVKDGLKILRFELKASMWSKRKGQLK